MSSFSSEWAIIIILASPLITGLSSYFKLTTKLAVSLLIFAAASVSMALLYFSDLKTSVTFFNFISFSLDRYSQLFLIMVNCAWSLTWIYSIGYLKYNFEERWLEFHRRVSFAIFTVLGTGLAENLFTLILFYSLSGFAILPLITEFKFKQQKIAKIYFLNVIVPPLITILPVGICLHIMTIPFDQLDIKSLNLNDFEASLLLCGFVIFFSKNCVFPFNSWLPKSSFAPAPVSALIHTVGAVLTGSIAVLKVGHYVYGFEYLATLNEDFFKTGWLTYLCGGTAVYTAFLALRTTNLKKRFSYSTVGQLSYILTAILIGTPAALAGAILHMITHALAKMTLFFNAGILSSSFQITETYQFARVAPSLKWLVLSSGIAGLSITGFPLLAGYHSKHLMLIEELHSHHYAAAIFLLLGSLLNFLYIYPILQAGFWPLIQKHLLKKTIIFEIAEGRVPLSMVIASAITSFGIILFSNYTWVVVRFFDHYQ